PGLVVSATAPDGVVEAVEDPTHRFCLGVQWHPENFYRTGEFRALFEGFIAAARRAQRARSSPRARKSERDRSPTARAAGSLRRPACVHRARAWRRRTTH